MWRVLKRVYRYPWYSFLTAGIFVGTLTFIIWFQNLPLIIDLMTSSALSVSDKAMFLGSLYGSIATNFTLLTASYAILLSLLLGLNVSLLVFYVRLVRAGSSTGHAVKVTGLSGLVSGVLGIGCAACGSIILTSFLATFGAGGLLLWLPLHGAEFGILGALLLLFSTYLMAKKISDPLVCPT